MNWNDQGIVLSARPHGESSLIVHLLTREHGRHAGLVRGGQTVRGRGLYQPGNLVAAVWSGRLAEHLGTYSCELMAAHAARILDEPDRLLALSAAAAILEQTLPERQPHPASFEGFLALLPCLGEAHWAEVYVKWELALLAELGFGLDLDACALGGDKDQLGYVSPKSGRAVSRGRGEPYREKLLVLPDFLAGRGGGGGEAVSQGLTLTGYFLERHIYHPQQRLLPSARRRLAERFLAA